MKRIVLIIFFGLVFCHGFTQTLWIQQRDSLLKALSISKEDTNRILILKNLGVQYLDNQLDSAAYYANAFGELSKRLNFTWGIITSLSMRAYVLENQFPSKEDEALTLDLEAIQLAKKANLKKGLANVYNNTAIIYEEIKGDHASSLDYYLKALDVYMQIKDSSDMAMCYSNIGEVYNSLKEYKKGYKYSLEGVLLYRSLHEAAIIRSGILALSTSLIYLKRYDTALAVLADAKSLAYNMNDKNYEQAILIKLITIHTKTSSLPELKKSAEDLLAVAQINNSNSEGMCWAWAGLSDYYFYKKNYTIALSYNDKIINLAKSEKLTVLLAFAYERIGRIELATGNLALYDHYKELQDSLNDQVLSDKILKNTQEIEGRYSLNEKEAEINSLNAEEKINSLVLYQHRTTNRILIAIIIAFAIIGFLFYSNTKHKKKLLLSEAALREQKIIELEKEKQLLATRSVLLGQEEERKRLAKDLHDGLGGLLSVAKYSFTNMKQDLALSPENEIAFNRSMEFLNKSIQELRRVAKNMMPEALMEFGLDTALKDYCNSITNNGSIQIIYQSFEVTDDSVSPAIATIIYRIIQELINNILKHSNATKAVVQLVKRTDALSITVEDNGKGFDMKILNDSTGIGYLNLKNRVSYLEGTMDIQTAIGKGTFVSIEIPNIQK